MITPNGVTAIFVIIAIVIGFIVIFDMTKDDEYEYHKWVNQRNVFHNIEEMPVELEMKAKILLVDYYNDRAETVADQITVDDVAIVWFAKTLKNWKTVLVTKDSGGLMFEITYNGEKGEAYIDAYTKYENFVVQDDPIVKLRERLSGNARDI